MGAQLGNTLYAGSAVFEQRLVTGNVSSPEALHLYSGLGTDIVLQPGAGGGEAGRVVIHSDVSLENYKITADTFNATESLILGNITVDVATSTILTSGGDITFAPAVGGRIVLDQQTCAFCLHSARHAVRHNSSQFF
jgi:hypothetical protein